MISSTTNKQVKFVNALVKKAKTRREEDLFVAEGLRMCSEIPKDRIHTLYISEAFSKTKECKALWESVKHIELVTDEVFKSLSDTQSPQGILALVKQYHYTLDEVAGASQKTGKPALLMVLETIQDPGNLGNHPARGRGSRRNRCGYGREHRGHLQSQGYPFHHGFRAPHAICLCGEPS